MNDMVRALAALATPEEALSGDASRRPAVEFAPAFSRACHGGAQHVYTFPNGWAASVVSHDFSYGGDAGLWEIGVGRWDGEYFALDYSTSVTDDVLGHQDDDAVAAVLLAVAQLAQATA